MRGMLILVLALASLPGCQQKWTGDRLTMTTYHSFNDSPNQGWRVFAVRGDYGQAASLLSRYIDANQPILQDWQIATLRFHQGQMLGCQGKYQLALQMLAKAKAGDFATLMIAFPCSTFSISRFFDASTENGGDSGPPVIRSHQRLRLP